MIPHRGWANIPLLKVLLLLLVIQSLYSIFTFVVQPLETENKSVKNMVQMRSDILGMREEMRGVLDHQTKTIENMNMIEMRSNILEMREVLEH